LFLFLISCSNAGSLSQDALMSLGLLNYRQNATIKGTFFGIYNANIKAVALGADGKCATSSEGNGSSDTGSKGEFELSYKRFAESGGNVCLVAYPKENGSRFLAVDQQKEIDWNGSEKFQVLVMPEPSSTSRSQFNVVSTPFNRMAARRLERLAKGNSDPSRLSDHLKSANRQIVSQFGLSRGLSKSFDRASSVELATPELTSINVDFSKLDDPMTLKFTVMIGGLHKMAIPAKPDTYNDVVKVVSEYISSGTGNSVGEDGKPILLPKDNPENKGLCSDCAGTGKPLSEGNSLSKQVSLAVNSFVAEKAADLGIPAEAVATITAQVVVQDKPAFGPTAPTTVDSPKPQATYGGTSFIYTLGSKISLNPSYSNASLFMLKDEGTLPKGLKINETTGEIYGVSEKLEVANFKIKVSGIGGEITLPLKIEVVPVPTININSPAICSGNVGELITCKYSTSGININPFTEGIETFSITGNLPVNTFFDQKTASIIGNTTQTCKPSECKVTILGSGKGGSTSISIQFIETPSFAYPDVLYTFLPGDSINIPTVNVRATDSFSINSKNLPSGLELNPKTGFITGTPSSSSPTSTSLSIKATGGW